MILYNLRFTALKMIRTRFSKLTIALIMLGLMMSVLAQHEHTELAKAVELKNEQINKIGDYKYYKFTVESGFKKDMDITIKTALTEEHPWANPNIYLSKTEHFPNATSSHQIGKITLNASKSKL
jgi:hypothetical protein